jgi:outer membrane protein TolC
MVARRPVRFLGIFVISLAASAASYGQVPAAGGGSNAGGNLPGTAVEFRVADTTSVPKNWIAGYIDPIQGSSSVDLVRRALTTNAQLAAARLEINRAGARLRQAGSRPNPSVEFLRQNGVFGSPGERGTTVAFSGYGFSIILPILNRNQGAKAEAQLAITQAQRRREFTESLIRAEVAAAYRRYEAAQASIQTYERGVIARSEQNVQTMRAAYQAGAFRVSELLVEQRRMVDSQREVTEAMAERFRALSDLRAAMGITD